MTARSGRHSYRANYDVELGHQRPQQQPQQHSPHDSDSNNSDYEAESPRSPSAPRRGAVLPITTSSSPSTSRRVTTPALTTATTASSTTTTTTTSTTTSTGRGRRSRVAGGRASDSDSHWQPRSESPLHLEPREVAEPMSAALNMERIEQLRHIRAKLDKMGPLEALLERNLYGDSVPSINEDDPTWVTRPYRNGLYALHIACHKGYVKTTRYLIEECHCDVNVTEAHSGVSPLHLACSRGYAYLAYILVKQYHADVNLRDNRLETPLASAAFRGCLTVVQVLVQNCNANLTLRDVYGDTPSEIAERTNHHHVALFLEGYNHKPTREKTSVSLDELVTIPASGEELEDKTKLQLELTNQSLENQDKVPECQVRSIEEGTHKDPMSYISLQRSALAVRIGCGRALLSGRDCLSCSQVCTIWRRQLSADDSVWIPHIREELQNSVRNTMKYMDENIPKDRKKEWKTAAALIVFRKWLKTPSEMECGNPKKFRHNSKEKYLWVMRKKGRVPLPETDDELPTYNPLIHDKWWSPRDVARFFWCYIQHYKWLGFFIEHCALIKESCDSKVLASVRNSLGVVGLVVTLLLFGKCLSIPRKETDNNCELGPHEHNYVGISVMFSVLSSFILYAFSLGSKKNMWYWFPIVVVILGTIPFPSEWICFFRAITHPNLIFVAVASTVMLISTFLFSKYKLKETNKLKSLGIGILVTIVGLIIWYDRFMMVIRAGGTAVHILRRFYPTYDLTWGRHKMAMGAFVVVILQCLIVFLFVR
ncbi:hypothetical protein Pelo_4648 [Pelomyxa schiedti]|nr:hypothetical protein Pelo_4648 [Pelomyxa schiedti]